MPDIILKTVPGKNLHFEIAGFQLKGMYENVAIGTVEDISYIDFNQHSATVLEEENLTDCMGNLNVDNDNNVFDSASMPVRTITQAELKKTIRLFKALLIKKVEIKYTDLFRSTKMNVPAHEQQTWAVQKEEAEKWQKDPEAKLDFLPVLAEKRGVSVETLAGKIIEKTNAFNLKMADLLGEQKNISDRIKASESMDQLREIGKEI